MAMGFSNMPRRSSADALRTREDLLTSARTLFTERGYSDASLSAICDAAGMTKGALFHHFKSKEDIFGEVWTQLQTEMDATARNAAIAARSRTDPYSAFLAGCRTYLEWAARPDYQKIVLLDGPSVLGAVGWYESDHDLGNTNVRAGIKYLAKCEIISENRIDTYATLVQSALNGAGFALARNRRGMTADDIYSAFEVLLKGLR